MGRTLEENHRRVEQRKKVYEVTSKHSAKADGLVKLRNQLVAAGASVGMPTRKGYRVEMTGAQREQFGNDHSDVRFAEVPVQNDSSSDMTSSSSST
ncbi:hypothetical protein PENSPDRAFT_688933 [Peniophora sp. CONT]|nr:hypothetical protein PENSPDRAFT_688933 [Peniophora sp. CONT]